MPWADVVYACDARWWDVYGPEVLASFHGERWTADPHAAGRWAANYIHSVDETGLSKRAGRIHQGMNSGYQAIGLAFDFGAKGIVLLGYDFQRTGGRSHHHGDHEGELPNLGNLPGWVEAMAPMAADLRAAGVPVVNATRATALKCFERALIAQALGIEARPLHVVGMHGLGDNLHQRAVLRELMSTRQLWLETPWPAVYHDLVGERLKLVNKPSRLRTQAKNAERERDKFDAARAPAGIDMQVVSYAPQAVRKAGGVLAAMAATCGVPDAIDFTLPVPAAWAVRAKRWIRKWAPTKPLLLYRPLNERTEWGGCRARNPEHEAYAQLLESIADRFFVVSIADLVPNVEWMVGRRISADVELHAGELDFETMAALSARAALVYTSPGFAAVLAQAVGTPVVVVFGGYENGKSFSAGARFAPYLPIEPINPCACFSHGHQCDKRIDMNLAHRRLREFLNVSDQSRT